MINETKVQKCKLAIQNLNCLNAHVSGYHQIAIDIAIKALEKQIPKRPKIKKVGFKSISYDCPICENYLVSEIDNELVAGQKYNYCHKCGQRLDWSDIT